MIDHVAALEARLALLALFAVAEIDAPIRCARTLDRAAAAAATMSDPLVPGGDTTRERTSVRLGAARLLNALCGACGACPRGRDKEAAAEITPGPPAQAA